MMHHPLVTSVRQTIQDFGMLNPKDNILVAVSGGPDSVALLHLLLALKAEFDIHIEVAHLNHGLRPSTSDRDANFVSSLCATLGLQLHTDRADIDKLDSGSLEAQMREVRYAFFKRIAKQVGCTKIAIGHHRNDNAELVLMNLFRGSGPLGLAGISPLRGNLYIRPLIHVFRKDIIDFLKENKLSFVWDESNRDDRFLRNRIRHNLIPILCRDYNPNLVDTLNRTTEIIRNENDFLDGYVRKLFSTMVDRHDGSIRLALIELMDHHIALRRRILRLAILHARGTLQKVTHQHIQAILILCEQGIPGKGLDLPDNFYVHIDSQRNVCIDTTPRSREMMGGPGSNNFLPLYKARIPSPESGSLKLEIQPLEATLEMTCMDISSVSSLTSAGQYTAFFDMDKLTSPLLLRGPLPGDRFRPLGMQGSQKIKDFFINNKISRELRPRIPILLNGEDIIWIVGFRIDERFRVTKATKTVLKAQLFLA